MVWRYDEPGGLDEQARAFLAAAQIEATPKQVRAIAQALRAYIDAFCQDAQGVVEAWKEQRKESAGLLAWTLDDERRWQFEMEAVTEALMAVRSPRGMSAGWPQREAPRA